MKWYWKVRLYGPEGTYGHAYVETSRDLQEIDLFQDFYQKLTGCRMLLEGMSEERPAGAETSLSSVFQLIWLNQGPLKGEPR